MGLDFLVTALIVVVAPGTGVLYTLAVGLGQGRRASLWAAFGCTLGIVPHLLAAVFGLAAVLHASAVAFQAVKIAGVVFLLYMAWTMLREDGPLAVPAAGEATGDARAGAARARPARIVRRGILLNLLNPKLSVFFLAFLPQFVDAGGPGDAGGGGAASGAVGQMLGLGAVFMGLTLAVFVAYGAAAAACRRVLARPRVMAWMRRLFAGAFAMLGARLALESR